MNVLDKEENFLYRLKYKVSLGGVMWQLRERSALEIAPSRTAWGNSTAELPTELAVTDLAFRQMVLSGIDTLASV